MSKMENTFKWSKAAGGTGKTYTGISPIIVDNTTDEISLDKSDLATIKYVDYSITSLNENTKKIYQTKIDGANDYNSLDKDIGRLQKDMGYIGTRTTMLENQMKVKQNTLIAGNNITIDEKTNTISSSGGGSAEVWETLKFTQTTTGFNILNITKYKKLKLSTTSILKLSTTIEADYMGSWIAPNTLDLISSGIISIPLTTNESSKYYVGGYIELDKINGVGQFKVRYLNGGTFGVTGTTEWLGDIIIRGVKK